MSKGKVVLGTLAGIAIGAIAGILLAPEKGAKTRKKIMGKGGESLNDLKLILNDFTDSLAAKFEKNGQEAENLLGKGKSKNDSPKKEAKNTSSESGDS